MSRWHGYRTAAEIERLAGGAELFAGHAGTIALEVRRGDRTAIARELADVMAALGDDRDAFAMWVEERTPLSSYAAEMILGGSR